jgi:putative acetyltransferase
MITVRPACVEDAAALAAAERETAETPGLLVSRPHELPPAAFEEKIAQLSTRGRYVVAVEEGRIVGHALLDPMALEGVSHVVRLTVVAHPGCRSRGVGKALVSDLLSWSAATPWVEKVELLVRATNRAAIELYRKFGFVEEGRLRHRVKLPDGSTVDDLTMAWFPPR